MPYIHLAPGWLDIVESCSWVMTSLAKTLQRHCALRYLSGHVLKEWRVFLSKYWLSTASDSFANWWQYVSASSTDKNDSTVRGSIITSASSSLSAYFFSFSYDGMLLSRSDSSDSSVGRRDNASAAVCFCPAGARSQNRIPWGVDANEQVDRRTLLNQFSLSTLDGLSWRSTTFPEHRSGIAS